MSALNPNYHCECGEPERCADPRYDTAEPELRAFYNIHPLRRGLSQSVRSRNYDAQLDREAAARRAGPK